MIIGVTGLIGSGKSTAAKILKSYGFAVIDADKIGHKVVDKNPELLKKLVYAFGEEILTKAKKLNRKKLAFLAFQNESSKNKLNRLVHPYLLKELKKQIKELSHEKEFIVIDAALLLDWNLDKIVDLVIMIHTSQKLRLKRLSKRGISKKDALARQSQQPSYRQFRERSDYVVFNNKTPQHLRKKLEKIIKKEVIHDIDI